MHQEQHARAGRYVATRSAFCVNWDPARRDVAARSAFCVNRDHARHDVATGSAICVHQEQHALGGPRDARVVCTGSPAGGLLKAFSRLVPKCT